MRLTTLRYLKLSPEIKELRIHLCQIGDSSKGAREFVMKHYPAIKNDNPGLPILIRECEGVQPKLWARFAMGKETNVSLTNKSAEEVVTYVECAGKK